MNWNENYGRDENGIVRASVDYEADHAFRNKWYEGAGWDVDACEIARRELGADFTEPETSEDVDKIGRQLEHLATIAEEEADSATDDAQALALLRRARELRKAGEALRVSDDDRLFFSQWNGDHELAEALQLLADWDEAHGDRAWMDGGDDEKIGAVAAYEQELRGSRSGFTEMVVEATDEWLTISFSGYGCDMRDVSLVVRRGDAVDALTNWASDAPLWHVDEALTVDAEHPGAVRRAVSCLNEWLLDPSVEELLDAARALGPVSDADMDRVLHSFSALKEEWAGDFSELVRACVSLTLVG